MTRDIAVQSGWPPESIEHALLPLGCLNAVSPDEDVDAAVTEVARGARSASAADQRLIRTHAIDRLSLPRAEWTLDQRTELVDAHLSRTGACRADEWGPPIPLDAHVELPPFPLATLAGWLREWVAAEAHATQTPPDMAAMLAFAVLATACQRAMLVRVREGWMEQLCIYTAIVMPPGTRKSAVMRDAREPLDAYELQQHERLALEITRSQDALAAAERRLARAIDRASKVEGPERMAAEADMHDARAELTTAQSGIVCAPQLSCGDTTQEALAHLLARNGECVALLDAEGCGPLSIMAGRYTDGTAAIDLYLRAHAGDAYRYDRVSRETISLRRPALTVAITMQPEMLQQLGARREMRGLGLLARFLWCVPESTVGRRTSRPQSMPEQVHALYASHVRALLDLERRENGEPHVVQFSAAADDMLAAWSDRLEPRLGAGGDLEHVADWASKLSGACARVAGLLHAAEHPECPWSGEISADTIRRAILIGEYLLAHALAALGEMGLDPVVADARHVLRWIQITNKTGFSKRDAHQDLRGRFKRAKEIEPALELLEERDWIRSVMAAPRKGAGRKPSQGYLAHPSSQKPHKPQHSPATHATSHLEDCEYSESESRDSEVAL